MYTRYQLYKYGTRNIIVGLIVGAIVAALIFAVYVVAYDATTIDLKNGWALRESIHTLELNAKDSRIRYLTELITSREDLIDECDLNDMELMKKYDYVIAEAPADGGLTFDMLKYADQLCKEYNINPHLVWGIVDMESSFDIDAKNPTSTARGLGQFLEDAGKYAYEVYLGYSDYKHEYAENPYTNIEMIIGTLNYLREFYNGDHVKIIMHYSGSAAGNMAYYNKLTTEMSMYGNDISMLEYVE